MGNDKEKPNEHFANILSHLICVICGKRQNNALYEPNILTGFAGGGKAKHEDVA